MSDHQPTFTLDEYRHILICALQSGYTFIGFQDIDAPAPFCLLRHDIDSDLKQATLLGATENELGVQSTYFVMLRSPIYNLFSRANSKYVNELLAQGHAIGLHFDEAFHPSMSIEELQDSVDQEVALLEKTFGTQIHAVSFHQPGSRILDNDIPLRNGLINTYNTQDLAGIHYLSDTNMNWREGCPSHLFQKQQYSKLQLLIHPMWWTPESMSVEKKWDKALLEQFGLMQEQLLQCERAFGPERAFTIHRE